ncbi:MAG: DUF871 domain-containing protein [Selenomonadaceae bacterium]|nr:DUF871 domain-containing protein [Selenomonadaceae bacterium]
MTMEKGITIYPGLDNTPEENLSLLERAADYGFRRVLLALLLPYADRLRAKAELPNILRTAHRRKLDVIAALSPEVMEVLHITRLKLSAFHFMGISTLYLRHFSLANIAELSHNHYNISIQFDASKLTEDDVAELLEREPKVEQLDALHSFYPRLNSGMSEENLIRKTVLLHRAGIKVGAFLPSAGRKRGPFGDGIPSMEMHRYFSADLAARHYIAIGMDSVFFGDSLPTDEELAILSSLPDNDITLSANTCTKQEAVKRILSHPFTAHIDEARDSVRAIEGSWYLKRERATVRPENTIERQVGHITVDNETSPGYMGEVNIVKRPSAASPRVNVAAVIPEDETFLVNYIMPGRRFRLRLS